MNKGTKLVLVIFVIMIIAIIGLIVYNKHLANKLDEANNQLSITKDSVKTTVIPIKTYTDTAGRNHIVIITDANKIKSADLKKATKGTVKLIDSVNIALGLGVKNTDKLNQVTKANFELEQNNIILKAERDSLRRIIRYSFKDKYLDFTARPDTAIPPTGNLIGSYKINSDLNWVDYSKRTWFLASKKQYTDIYSDNPNISIRGLERVTIEHPLSQFGLRLKASASYNFNTNSPSFGPGLEIDINNRFNISGFYLKNFNTNTINPVIRADYNLFSF